MLTTGLDQRGGKKRRDAARHEKRRKAAFFLNHDSSSHQRRRMLQTEAKELFEAILRPRLTTHMATVMSEKLTFRALTLCQSDWKNCELCVGLVCRKWSYAIGGSMVTRKQE